MLEHDPRLSLLRTWLTRDLGWRIGRISIASADASFRRYFRVSRGDVDPAAWAPKADTLILMDAPPGKEDIAPYLKVTSLLEHERIETTEAKAKEIRGFTDRMITLGKDGSLPARRRALSFLRSKDVVSKLFSDVAGRFKDRPGGYTRMVKTRRRVGDAAELVAIELVARADAAPAKKSAATPAKTEKSE